jgi:hypothetical protein
MRKDSLRRGMVVEVRSPAEILATLDGQGRLEGLPFMPEMLQYCGRRFVVDRRAEKICDTITPVGSRQMPNTVLLEDLRCDGSGHDGCQAECRLFWKEAWLRRVRGYAGDGRTADEDEARERLASLLQASTKSTSNVNGTAAGTYMCQVTELNRASRPLKTFDPRPYIREFTSGNVSLIYFLRITIRAVVYEVSRKLGLKPAILLPGTATRSVPETPLNLQAGDRVVVKSKEDIAATLTPKGANRGLWFDGAEMMPFCGQACTVRQRVHRFIDDRSRQMVELKTDSVTLDGVVCSGERSWARWFCPRGIYPYWREAWLRPADSRGSHEAPRENQLDLDPRHPDRLHHVGTAQQHEPEPGALADSD